MVHSFEEVASRELDDLYRQALFLSAGDRGEAEALLLDALAGSYRAYDGPRPGGGDPREWLQSRLVRRFLARRGGDAGPGKDRPVEMGRGLSRGVQVDEPPRADALDPAALFRAAGRIPPRARAAIWLVVFGRRAYDDAAEVLDATADELRDLVRHRHAFVAHVMEGGPESGEDGGEVAL